MTSQSPRIYTYKITFEEVPYYYYGSKKEKYYNQPYMGSPVTNKWVWEYYTPKKQILEVFGYTDEGYEECRKMEDRLIKPVINDPWCLNESFGGKISLKILQENGRALGNIYGKINGKKTYENKTGIHALTPEKRKEVAIMGGMVGGKTSGKKMYEMKKGIHAFSKEMRQKIGEENGKMNYENKVGIHGLTPEEKSEAGRKGGAIAGNKNKENKIGIFSLTKEQKSELGKILNSQKWKCIITGYVSTPGGLSRYQKKRGIDTSLRERIE